VHCGVNKEKEIIGEAKETMENLIATQKK